MILQDVRLTVRLHRFELYAFGAGLIGLAIAAFGIAAYIDTLRPTPGCAASLLTGLSTPACQRALDTFNSVAGSLGAVVMSPLLVVTSVVGIFLGVPIVARELERGTTRLAWSLAPSRWRWLVARAVPVLAILVLLTFASGVAIDRYFGASLLNEDPAASFTAYGIRGGLLASRAAFVFGIGVLVGAVVGRALPAVILTGLIASIALGGGQVFQHNVILRNEAVPVPVDLAEGNSTTGLGDLYIDTAFQLPDGSLVGYEYFANDDPYDAGGNPIYPMFTMVIPGSQYRFVEAREALVLAGLTLVALVLAGFVVGRRRPG